MEKLNSKDRLKYRGISGIYALIYNNEIIYIGQSVNIGSRLTAHNSKNRYEITKKKMEQEGFGKCCREKSLVMYDLIRHHRDDIEFQILEQCSVELLNQLEEKYIVQYQPCFNYKGVDVPYI